MIFFDWNESYEVGVAEIDQQHLKLVDMINALHDAMLVGQGGGMLGELLQKLIDYTYYHFESEENFMKISGYTGLLQHQKEHAKLIDQVVEYQKRFEMGRLKNSVDTMRFLKEWLLNHILENDMNAVATILKTN